VVTAVADEEALHPAAVGQPRHPHVEIHPIDALDLEQRVIAQGMTARCLVEAGQQAEKAVLVS
jgi:hypothetical protein